MKVVVLGGVAAGTKTAAKLKREDRAAEVIVYTLDKNISYAGCGLPYYIGGVIETEEELIVNTPSKFSALTGVEVKTGQEAIAVDPQGKTVRIRDVDTGTTETVSYDKLVLATGAAAIMPPIPGIDKKGIFKVRTPADAVQMRAYVETSGVKRAVIIGAGFIGLEVAENLHARGIHVTVVEAMPQIMSGVMDAEMAAFAQKHLFRQGISVLTATKAVEILGGEQVTGVKTDGGLLQGELVVVAVGIRPNTAYLKDSGIETFKGAVLTDAQMRTNVTDIYATGDCAMTRSRITGKPQWSPMGSSANLEGRTLAQILGGKSNAYPGVLGTGVVKLPNLNCGRTGLTEAAAKAEGLDVVTVLAVTDDKAHYYPDSGFFATKLIAEKSTHRLLGVQVLGGGAVDKMVDIAVTGINMGAKLEDFDNADYAYAPPFSTAIHPFVQAVHMLLNKLNGDMVSMTPAEYAAGAAAEFKVIDVGMQPSISGATYIDLSKVNGPIAGIGKDEKLLLVCAKGKRAYFLQNRLKFYGYTQTAVLEGATFFNDVRVKNPGMKVSAEDVARVKALGCLWDKRTPDIFNVRVITRNGKITAAESKAISDAATIYGSGEITMTTRLTLEIQGVPYDNIEPLRDYLAGAGLETGGTGSKVRPVVSCKGTTCQYGLIDTFSISEEIHERFFHGYSGVKLPHKFKIAVGGCPNNCVKPDLNDIGIVGQRIPQIDLEKCRGCKICQVEKQCPIQAARVVNGKLAVTDCNHCGRCVEKCPFKAVDAYTIGYRIYIGGRWGKKIAQGRYLDTVFTEREAVMDVVEKAILLFREQGKTGERFADTVARLGFENVQEQLLADGLLARKTDNLQAQKHLKGGATC